MGHPGDTKPKPGFAKSRRTYAECMNTFREKISDAEFAADSRICRIEKKNTHCTVTLWYSAEVRGV